MGYLKLRATGLDSGLEDFSRLLVEVVNSAENFEVISVSRDYQCRDSKEVKRYYEFRLNAPRLKEPSQ